MSAYSIEVIAGLCGVNPVTLRAWQRYGLLNPVRNDKGQRFYNDEDLFQAHLILEWLSKGVPINQVRGIIAGEVDNIELGWQTQRKELCELLDPPQPNKLRNLLWRFGREYPGRNLVNDILRPIRKSLSAAKPVGWQQQVSVLDCAIIEYATFALTTARKHSGARVLLVAWNNRSSIELWLESIQLVSEGLRVELIPHPVSWPDLTQFEMDHYLLWSDKRLSEVQQALFDDWLKQGLPVMLVGKVTQLKKKAATRAVAQRVGKLVTDGLRREAQSSPQSET